MSVYQHQPVGSPFLCRVCLRLTISFQSLPPPRFFLVVCLCLTFSCRVCLCLTFSLQHVSASPLSCSLSLPHLFLVVRLCLTSNCRVCLSLTFSLQNLPLTHLLLVEVTRGCLYPPDDLHLPVVGQCLVSGTFDTATWSIIKLVQLVRPCLKGSVSGGAVEAMLGGERGRGAAPNSCPLPYWAQKFLHNNKLINYEIHTKTI